MNKNGYKRELFGGSVVLILGDDEKHVEAMAEVHVDKMILRDVGDVQALKAILDEAARRLHQAHQPPGFRRNTAAMTIAKER